MTCDAFFERSVRNRINQNFPINTISNNVLSQPHQLVGTEIWLRDQRDEEKILAEGVTKIEFREGEIFFQTVLGEEIRVKAEIQRSLLTEQGFIFEVAGLDPPALPQRIVPLQPEATEISR